MDGLSTPLGIALIVVAIFAIAKAVKAAVKVAMLVIIAIGAYLWFGVG